MTLLRLLPIAPFTVVNLVAGAVGDPRLATYCSAACSACCPGIVLMTVFGDRLGAWLRQPDAANLAVLVGVALAAFAADLGCSALGAAPAPP